jgi:hypothetical protein
MHVGVLFGSSLSVVMVGVRMRANAKLNSVCEVATLLYTGYRLLVAMEKRQLRRKGRWTKLQLLFYRLTKGQKKTALKGFLKTV